MKKSKAAIVFLLLFSILLLPFVQSAGAALAAGRTAGSAAEDKVYIISVEKAVEAGLSSYMQRAFALANGDSGVRLIILEIDTPGGLVTAAQSIRKTIEGSPVETVALVKGGAISAGTYIAMSCDKIAMQPGTTIGDVEPRVGNETADEKYLSAWRAEMSSLAEAHGRDKEIAKAMVDRNMVIEGVKEAGQLLTLTANEAKELGYADYLVANRAELKELYDLGHAREMEIEVSTAERVSRFVTNPGIAPFILMIGIAGVIIEILTAGFGVAGIIGGGCLILYFAGHMIAGFTGWGAVLLFLVGIILLAVEAFVPGFGVFGISGILALMVSVILVAPSFQIGLQSFVIAFIGSIILIAVAVKFLRRSKYWDKLSLQLSFNKEQGYISQREDFSVYIGRKGKTATALRPAGIVILDDGKRLDVVSEGEFVEKDQWVIVSRIDGPKIFVARHPMM